MRKILLPLLLLGVSCGSDVVYRTASYELLRDGVTQAQYTARVLSDTRSSPTLRVPRRAPTALPNSAGGSGPIFRPIPG